MRISSHGFSLIELMIVVAIIGILSTLALPCYQKYTERARFAEVLISTETYKMAIALALQRGIDPNELNSGVQGIPDEAKATNNVASISVNKAIITALSTPAAGSASYILKPDASGSHWSIKGTCVNLGLCQT